MWPGGETDLLQHALELRQLATSCLELGQDSQPEHEDQDHGRTKLRTTSGDGDLELDAEAWGSRTRRTEVLKTRGKSFSDKKKLGKNWRSNEGWRKHSSGAGQHAWRIGRIGRIGRSGRRGSSGART